MSVTSKKSTWVRASLSLAMLGFGLGCSPAPANQGAAAVDAAITRLQSGAMVKQIETELTAARASPPASASLTDEAPALEAAPSATACDDVSAVAVTGPDADVKLAAELGRLGDCLRLTMRQAFVAQTAIAFTKAYLLQPGEPKLSTLTGDELEEFVALNWTPPRLVFGSTSPLLGRLRSSFTAEDFIEITALQARKRDALVEAETALVDAVDAHRPLIAQAAAKFDRYGLLLAIRDTVSDTKGADTNTRLLSLLQRTGFVVARDPAVFPVAMLHPYALLAVVPDVGAEASALDPSYGNPYLAVLRAMAELGGDAASVKLATEAYLTVGKRDNPALPAHAPAAADAVRVAFVDSGLDFMQYPDLGLFLGRGTGGEIASADYADGDANPWLIGTGTFAHGSGTVATLLTLISHHAPEVLRDRKLDLAMWKSFTIRTALGGKYATYGDWENRLGAQEAIISRASSVADKSVVQPKIVSISMVLKLQPFLARAGKEAVLKSTPWLWVMAAGNSGVAVEKDLLPPCLNDVPVANRPPAERILCVGALGQGIVDDRIAGYSNFGPRVDVYAFDSYIGLCPNGTSCATPAISGAAAIIAAKVPGITPERIKAAIVAASDDKELEIDLATASPEIKRMIQSGFTSARRKVKVFNPPAMLPRAIEAARKLVGKP